MENQFNLQRFKDAQQRDYQTALAEIRNGRKQSHWMWYIFPQMAGLGHSTMSAYYGIRGLEEARAYLDDPVLGGHLKEICQALLQIDGSSAGEIFGWPDDIKLRSSMTLFAVAAGGESVFRKVLDRYVDRKRDPKTWKLLGI